MNLAGTALERAGGAMAASGVDGLLVGAGADLRYLTGYVALPLERMTLLVARADGAHRLIVPTLERARAEEAGVQIEIVDFGERDDPFAEVTAALRGLGPDAVLGVGDQLWATFLLGLQEVRPHVRWTRASAITRELRMRKSPDEVARLRTVAQAIDRVHQRVPALLAPGRTESEVARDIATAMVEEGHDAPDFTIVASGPNGASPHHETGGRRIAEGDAVVVDIGGVRDGYYSDCTRNYVVGAAPDGYEEAEAALVAAQRAACEAVRPGVTAESVDEAARAVLRDAGYGDAFIHRTGHGIGMEVHEHPYIVGGNEQILEPGMTFSVEPGVYLPGRFGLRIEDIVAVTEDGAERLNTLDRAAVRR